jgi:hypothetical protein
VTAHPRHALDVAPGQPQPSLLAPVAEFFRRAIAAVLRKRAVPAVCAGTATAPFADRFPCCVHCLTGSPCDPADSHPRECGEGCNAPRPYDERHCAVPSAHGMTDPYYCTLPAHHYPLPDDTEPVMRDRWTWEVRAECEQWNAWHDDDMPAAFTPSAAMTTGEFAVLDAKVDAVLRRPRGQHPYPLRQPVYGERCQLDVERDMALAAGERARGRYQPPAPALLRQVLDGLVKL